METLPLEIKSHILSYLPLNYRLVMARMNSEWYSASLNRNLQREAVFVYTELTSSQCSSTVNNSQRYDTFMNTMINSRRSFLELKLCKLNYRNIRDVTYIKRLGGRVISLKLDELFHFTGAFLSAITSSFRNLESLEIVSIRNFSGFNQNVRQIPSLKAIHFKKLRMSDRSFNFIIQCAPFLKELSFHDCRVHINDEYVDFQYPDFQNRSAKYSNSNVILTDDAIIKYLKTSITIKILNLYDCLHIFYQLPQHVKLKTLRGSPQWTYDRLMFDVDIFGSMLNAHVSLTTLELFNIPIGCLLYLSNLCNLKHLSITYRTPNFLLILIDEEFDVNLLDCIFSFYNALKRMKYLKTLKINEISTNIRYSLKKKLLIPTKTLISVKNLDILIDSRFQELLKCTFDFKLENLRIHNCGILEPRDYVFLFQHLPNIVVLELYECGKLVDDVLIFSLLSKLKGLTTLSFWGTKLTHMSLRLINLFHLRKLKITISIEPIITSKKQSTNFEASLRYLGSQNPNLEFIYIDIPISQKKYIRKNRNLYKALTNIKKFKSYFKNVKKFFMPLE